MDVGWGVGKLTTEMGFEGKFDREAGTLWVSGAGMDLKSLDSALEWMEEIRRHLSYRQMMDDGGHRWEFQRGTVPTAQLMRGKQVWVRPFKLASIRPRKTQKCAACNAAIEAGTACWKQAPGTWSGHSHARFCDRCVERGAAPRRPRLRLVM